MLRRSLLSVLYNLLAIGAWIPPRGAVAYSRIGRMNVLYVWSAVRYSQPWKRPWTCLIRFCLVRTLLRMWLRCEFQFRYLFRYTPRYLTSSLSLSGVFQSVRCKSSLFCCFLRVRCLCWKRIVCVLVGLGRIRHCAIHFCSLCRYVFALFCIVFVRSSVHQYAVSSAYRPTVSVCVGGVGMSAV